MKTVMGLTKRLQIIAAAGLAGCALQPSLPESLGDRGVIVLGYSTDTAIPYAGGTLYRGFHLREVDGRALEPPLVQRYQYLLLAPGFHTLRGFCYWRLSSLTFAEDDLWEEGEVKLEVKAGFAYTIHAEIDEYKAQCALSLIAENYPD